MPERMIKQFSPLCSIATVLTLATFSALSITQTAADEIDPQARPNIVIVLADDLGYGDVQAFHKDSKIPTPNLNAMAKQGMIFTDAHSGSAVCTPTRYGLLTGRYCWRSRLKRGVLFPPKDAPLIENGRPTIASFLKENGYRTAMVGKWHLGIGWQKKSAQANDTDLPVDFNAPINDGPNEKGFDQWFGIAASLDMIPYSYLRDHQLVEPADETQEKLDFPRFVRAGPKSSQFDPGDVLDTLASEAIKFIDSASKQDAPFFLYLPLTSPHKPAWPHERFVGKTELGPYGDFVHQTDATIGQVIDALDKNGVADNTLVIVTSDNGSYMKRTAAGEKDHVELPSTQGYRTEHHRANGQWRGTKADIWEAGHRVPFLVRWPGQVAPDTSSDRPTVMTDIFATVAEVLGQKAPAAAEDSFSFREEMIGLESPQRPPLILHSVSGMFAIRDGDWKLVLGNGSGGREKPRGKSFERPYFLANLAEDPEEATNRTEGQPEVVERLEKSFKQIAGDWENSR